MHFCGRVAGLVILVELINDEVGMTVADVEVSTVDAPRGGHHPTVDDLLVADAARIPCRLEGSSVLALALATARCSSGCSRDKSACHGLRRRLIRIILIVAVIIGTVIGVIVLVIIFSPVGGVRQWLRGSYRYARLARFGLSVRV